MRLVHVVLCVCALYLASLGGALAQEDDKGFLTRTLQDALSGAGRTVSIDGFSGALSAQARFDRMTIADDDGVWLTLEDVSLIWSRAALLRGRLEVDSLTAARLVLPRLPKPQADALPAAEAEPFSLPDLPVSVNLAQFSIEDIALGAPILGEAARLSLSASARLDDQQGDIDLKAARKDAKRGLFQIKAQFDRGDSLLDLLLNLDEEAGGIAATLLGLPGEPSVRMRVEGSGPIDDFKADLSVATDGTERLAGQVTLGTQAPRRAGPTPDRRIKADIGGDITALLAPRFRAFLGADVRLVADAVLENNGAIEVSDFALEAQAVALAGKVSLGTDKWPTLIDVTGRIADPEGAPVLLPAGGEGVKVGSVDLRIAFDAAAGEAIEARFDIVGLSHAAAQVAQAELTLDGELAAQPGAGSRFDGDVTLQMSGLALTDQALAEAVGEQLRGSALLRYATGQPTRIDDLSLSGTDYALTGQAVLSGLAAGLASEIDLALTASDLSRFSALAGREIDGQSRLRLQGSITPLSGQFDLAAFGSTEDLALGIDQADAVLAGRTALRVAAKRDQNGTVIRDLVLENAALNLTGSAHLRTRNSQASAAFLLRDIGLALPEYDGPVRVRLDATEDTAGWRIDAATDGPYGAALTATGLATGPDAALQFTADVPDLGPFGADVAGTARAKGVLRRQGAGWHLQSDATGPFRSRATVQGMLSPAIDMGFEVALPDLRPLVPQVSGPLAASGRAWQTDEGFVVQTTASGPYNSTAEVTGLATGLAANLRFIASMPNIGVLVSDVTGPLALRGQLRRLGAGWQVQTEADGPSGTQAQIAGRVNPGGQLDLTLSGAAPLGLAGPFIAPRDLQGVARFDLAVRGPAALSSVSGRVETRGATLSAPNARLALNDIAAEVGLSGNRAQIDLSANAVNGGRLSVAGNVVMTGAMPADLAIAADQLVVIDPKLYRSTVDGRVRVAGPLAGGARISGQINVGETNVTVPATGLTTIGEIPAINHIGATRPVMATRRKAGIDAAEATGAARAPGPVYGLDLRIGAPRRIFVRGRGLDAELGGALNLRGTTQRIISSGQIALLRGRLDVLGKRLDLVDGDIYFEGDLVPYIRFISASETRAGEARVIVEGPADAPKVRFEATPEAPEDEVLAQLLFGRSLSDISALQALQLANAVASLAGRGGVGVISNLRKGFGLDDLDVATTDSGATSVRAGKYISENVYTDITAASDGTGEVSLNLDITSHLKGKATLGSDGNSGIGIFYEKDY